MCGIVAAISTRPDGLEAIRAMNQTIEHRGPDGAGCEVLTEDGVALAMRRLAIIDLSGGHQPMWDAEHEIGVVFNGEIYNHRELRGELERAGHRFHTDHSDTEVIVYGYREWGTDVFSRLNGMFGIAIWDRRERRLVLGRDRMGQKPLYIAKVPDGYLIASELKAFYQHPQFRPELDLEGLEQFLAFDYILSPRTILRGVAELPPAHFAVVTPEGYTTTRYWRMHFDGHERARSEQDLLQELDEHLDHAVETRMASDVPLGLFLSGGVDSSTIGYYMRKHSDDVHSFSIAFHEAEYDESHYARIVADHLGTTHHVEYLAADRMLDLLPRIPEILDEPMADPSIFPTYALSEFTRRHVTVALGGDGSDELIMGYKSYKVMKGLWSLDRVPRPLRRLAGAGARRLLGPQRTPWSRSRWLVQQPDITPERRLLSFLGAYRGDSRWVLSEAVRERLPSPAFSQDLAGFATDFEGRHSAANRTISAYVHGYLSEDILVKVDRASMAASLEARSPFLDPELIEFLGRVPERLKMKGATRKYLLRKLMRGRIPDEILDRPKQGFGIPLLGWLRGPLKPLVHEYLGPERLAEDGIFDPEAVGRLVRGHLEENLNFGNALWSLLQFQLWNERWLRAT